MQCAQCNNARATRQCGKCGVGFCSSHVNNHNHKCTWAGCQNAIVKGHPSFCSVHIRQQNLNAARYK